MDNSNNNLSTDEVASRYYDEIFNYCRRRVRSGEDAYDLTQSVFLALSERYNTIDIRCVRKWLYNVAHHKIADYYIKNKTEKEYLTDADPALHEACFDFTEEYTDTEIEKYSLAILSGLNEKEQKLYNEVYCQKLLYPALAKKYNISEACLRKRISRLKYKITHLIKLLLFQ
ncbi:MAG: RNA polymerase sigma factor [Eubacteriales bacterium]